MKRYALMFIVLVAGVLALTSCSTIGPKQVAARKVTKGMTQRQVCALLGEPSGKDVAGNREIWSYYFSGISSSLTAEATFLKDTLVRYRFIEGEGPRYYLDKRSPQPPAVQQSPTPIPVPIPQQSVRERRYNEEERAFNDFLRQMSGMPFPEEQLTLLRQTSQRCTYSVKQAIQILGIFDFEDEQLNALRIIAPRLRSGYSIGRLLEFFDEGPDRDEASRILEQGSKMPPQR